MLPKQFLGKKIIKFFFKFSVSAGHEETIFVFKNYGTVNIVLKKTAFQCLVNTFP